MSRKDLFQSASSKVPAANAVNHAGGVAYDLGPMNALAQMACTNCFNGTFYASPQDHLQVVLELAKQCDPHFVGQVAAYARQNGHMKDMPAALLAYLHGIKSPVAPKVFPLVIDNGKMLRNFVQMVRSGAMGRKSFGSSMKKQIAAWLQARKDDGLFYDSVGNSPSMADIIKMIHPKPSTPAQEALMGYMIGRDKHQENLPVQVKQYESFKIGESTEIPNVPFQMVSSIISDPRSWKEIATKARWHETRMNLNTYLRHDVYKDPGMVKMIADRLKDPEAIRAVRVFPYQLMTAFQNVSDDMPQAIKLALQDAMEIAVENVPVIKGKVYLLPDVSGSMRSPITGHRPGATTKTSCVDVAGLITAAFMRSNPEAVVIPFNGEIVNISLNPRDSVMTLANTISRSCYNGTNCSVPLVYLNQRLEKGDMVIYISDNESWIDSRDSGWGSVTMEEWMKFKRRNPGAKLVCIDITPNTTSQINPGKDILNVGGFSDDVFKIIASFAEGRPEDHWVNLIKAVKI